MMNLALAAFMVAAFIVAIPPDRVLATAGLMMVAFSLGAITDRQTRHG